MNRSNADAPSPFDKRGEGAFASEQNEQRDRRSLFTRPDVATNTSTIQLTIFGLTPKSSCR